MRIIGKQVEPDDSSLRTLLKGHEQTPFSVPGNYFTELPGRLEGKLKNPPSRLLKKKITIGPFWRYAAAAVFLTGLLAFFIFLSGEKKNSNKEMFSQAGVISCDSTSDTLITGTTEIDETMAMHGLTTTAISARNTDNQSIAKIMVDVPPDDIINFLLEEDFEVTDL